VEAGPDRQGIVSATPFLFREVQRFRQWIFWLPIIAVTGVVWWQFAEQIVRGNPQGQQPIPDWAAWILAVVFGLGFPLFGYLVRMITEVTKKTIKVGIYPFKRNEIPLDSIDTAMEREYSAQREFGGWGVRVSKYGKAYNAYGNKGVQLVLRDGSNILIGTQRSEELAAALREAGVKIVR
jgi:hypothetical protein